MASDNDAILQLGPSSNDFAVYSVGDVLPVHDSDQDSEGSRTMNEYYTRWNDNLTTGIRNRHNKPKMALRDVEANGKLPEKPKLVKSISLLEGPERRCRLTFDNVGFTVRARNGSTKTILSDVSGAVSAGEVLTIMG